jgi:gamma-glutamyltranspeptidase/glutathione hydrolase
MTRIALALLTLIVVTPSVSLADVYPGSIFDLEYRHTTYKPILHGKHWMALTGEPLSATAGAIIFMKGGNAADAAAAMLAAVCVLNDSISFGGETPALVYDPHRGKVFAVNGQGLAPTGATPEFFQGKGLAFPPGYGPLAATTPGTPGALILMLAEFGTMSLKEVLQPAIDLADGYPIELQTAALYSCRRGGPRDGQDSEAGPHGRHGSPLQG